MRIGFQARLNTIQKQPQAPPNLLNLKLMSEWIKKCNYSHDCMPLTGHGGDYPARLLEIGTVSSPSLKLVDMSQTTLRRRYVTLSYCWGDGIPLILLSSNLSKFQKGIEESSLPKTLRDAVIVARELGVRFIWIDALCIIQDSIDDWNREAPKMADIYSNTYCNIAATDSKTCNDGIFLDQYHRKPVIIPMTTDWDNIHTQYCILDRDFWMKKLDSSSLQTRGWVLQERYLSPRTIHLGEMLFWECFKALHSEFLPKPVADSRISFNKRLIGPLQQSEADPYTLWSTLVDNFSTRKLTFETDKLIAISGLARKLQLEIGNDKYVAGLWWNKLPCELTWAADGMCRWPSKYRAPSWSWASIDGFVLTHRYDPSDQELIEKLDYELEYVANDIYGEVSSGHIRVNGRLYPHRLSHRDKHWIAVFVDDDMNSDGYSAAVNLDVEEEGHNYAQDEYYCLPILYEKSNSDVRCLSLQPTGREQGEYFRVGSFHMAKKWFKEAVDIIVNESKPYKRDPELYQGGSTIILI
jgi:hypothetical protein